MTFKREPMVTGPQNSGISRSGLSTLLTEIAGLQQLHDALAGPLRPAFEEAVQVVRAIAGRVVVSGIGKSGHIGTKIAATLASTGTPAFFVHASEASHGDLGMITGDDAVLALSWSGETPELANIITFSRRFRVPLIAMTSNPDSALGAAADICLVLPDAKEACPHGLAPTTSSSMQMALGDALSIALLENRGFTALDFKTFHPGGRLGALLQYVGDIMHIGDRIPVAPAGTIMSEAIVLMSQKGFGCVGVTGPSGALIGVITDGDLRRHLSPDLIGQPVEKVMSPSPKSTTPQTLVSEALEVLHSMHITALFVVENQKPVGIVHLHDLLRAGVA